MLFSNYVNRTGRLLGAATVAGAISFGLLVAAPIVAQAGNGAGSYTTAANSIKAKAAQSDANSI